MWTPIVNRESSVVVAVKGRRLTSRCIRQQPSWLAALCHCMLGRVRRACDRNLTFPARQYAVNAERRSRSHSAQNDREPAPTFELRRCASPRAAAC